MEKRLLIAVILSSIVLLLWSLFFPKPQQVSFPPVDRPVVQSEAKEFLPSLKPEITESIVSVSPEKSEIIFSEHNAAIKEALFKEYQRYKFSLTNGFMLKNEFIFKQIKSSPSHAEFLYTDKEKEITKRFLFTNPSYSIGLQIDVKNISSAPITFHIPLVLGELDFGIATDQARLQDVTISTDDKILRPNAHKDQTFNQLNFLGLRNHYFCAILEPASKDYTGFIRKVNTKKTQIGIESKEFVILPGQIVQEKFRIYLGPQQLKLISAIKPQWGAMIHYGPFDIISHVLLQVLDFVFSIVHNWGLAIIILSIIIYIALYPLTLRQMRSMKEMQVLQPRIEKLRKLYKDNPQKLNKEVLELYKEHKVNPLGGCLPLILQMPIFFALYQALTRTIALKGAKFLWIKDLSEPDRFLNLPISLPGLGNEINLLPILMAVEMFLQQKFSAATTSVSSEQQKMMTVLFPLIFGFLFYRMPSGLVLYWFINSSLTLIYQLKVAKSK